MRNLICTVFFYKNANVNMYTDQNIRADKITGASAPVIREVPSRFELENKGFADLRLTSWLWHHNNGAVDGTRTRDIHLGKVALYQLSYYRIKCALGRNRTTDTVIFSHMLYRLSYQGVYGDPEGARTLDLQRDRLAL